MRHPIHALGAGYRTLRTFWLERQSTPLHFPFSVATALTTHRIGSKGFAPNAYLDRAGEVSTGKSIVEAVTQRQAR